jgi:tetratricopeptide (TPR) repeat protein
MYRCCQGLALTQAAIVANSLAILPLEHADMDRQAVLPGAEAASYVQAALILHQRGHLEEARRLYDAALASEPHDFDALHHMGVLRHQQGYSLEALRFIAAALDTRPAAADALANYGVILDALKRHQEALSAFEKVLEIRPGDATTYYNRGLALKNLGRYLDALASFERALVMAPDHVDALYQHGNALYALGRQREALADYGKVLAIQPRHTPVLSRCGNVLISMKRWREALLAYDAVLDLDPTNAESLSNRSVVLLELGRSQEALESCDSALEVQPRYAQALYNRGNALLALKRFEDACSSYEAALELEEDCIPALNNLGLALGKLGRPDEALLKYDKVLALDPNRDDTLHNRANALIELARFEEALAICDKALSVNSMRPDAANTRGVALEKLGRYDDALVSFDRALSLRPDFVEAHSNRGTALHGLNRYQEALECYKRATALQPDYAEAYSNQGNTLKGIGRPDEALVSYEKALALRPDLVDAHFNLALCSLLVGDFERGWREHEWRWKTVQQKIANRRFAQPLWLGAEEIAGKTILLHAEQGFGDTLQLCRYVPLVAERGAHVILEVPSVLHEVAHTLRCTVQIISHGDPLPDFDLHCPLLSLPLAFNTRAETIPAPASYLSAPKNRRDAWRNRFGRHEKLRVGLVWAGNPGEHWPGANRRDQHRSISLDQFTPILHIQACEFYSLQKGKYAVAQLRNSALRERVIDWTDDFVDFGDTAAVIEHLDLVITVDTSVAHLAGALGVPFWLLNRHATCWRWLLDRTDSPWYPTARLFRQDATRLWDGVIVRVCTALSDHALKFRPMSVSNRVADGSGPT